MIQTPDVVIFHGPCPDGFAAHWVLQKVYPDAKFFERGYTGKPIVVDDWHFDGMNVTNLHVLLVDFTYKHDTMVKLCDMATSVTVLDHHKSAEADLKALFDSHRITGVFDMERSGARLAWDAVHPDAFYCPKLVQYIEDCDLWRHSLPHAKEIQAAILSYPRSLEQWDDLSQQLEYSADFRRLVSEGEAIMRTRERMIESAIEHNARPMKIGGEQVLCCNASFELASEIGNRLALVDGNSFGATYYDSADGKRHFSLRSIAGKRDVSLVAVSYGGGGHVRASGFEKPMGWEGDDHVARVGAAFIKNFAKAVNEEEPDKPTEDELRLYHEVLTNSIYN